MLLVFGSNGQLAKELAKYKGVTCIGRAECDLSEPYAARNAIEKFNPQIVINAAAFTNVEKAEVEQDLAYLLNAKVPGDIAQQCYMRKIPFVHISTDYVFNGKGSKPWRETDEKHPLCFYGYSKAAGESLISNSECNYAIIRTSWVFSRFGNNFLKSMLHLDKSQETISVVADQIGGPTSASSLATTCYEIAKELINNFDKKGIYHFAGHPSISWAKYAELIFKLASRGIKVKPISTVEYASKVKRPLNSRLNCDKIGRVFGIIPPDWKYDLKKSLNDL